MPLAPIGEPAMRPTKCSNAGDCNRSRSLFTCLAALMPIAAAIADITQSSNEDVLREWTRATGMSARLIPAADGETELQWSGTITADAYHRSSSGGELLSPYTTGNFHALRVQSEARATAEKGGLSWAQLALTESNDPSLIPYPEQIGSLQLGHADNGYRVALGDVLMQTSTLGANTAMRGVSLQRELGTTLLSGTAGVIADSWEGLSSQSRRQLLLRNAAALHVQRPFGSSSQWFATMQGYEDDANSLDAQMQTALPASGRTVTTGITRTTGRFTFTTEAAASQFRERGSQWRNATAGVIDGQWTGDSITLRTGHHDFGKYFTSLAAGAVPGLRETYINATWSVTPYATLTGDLRQTRNRNVIAPAVPTMPVPGFVASASPLPAKSNAASLQANVTLERVPGLSLLLLTSQSRGENSDGGRNDTQTHAVSATWARTVWSTTVGYQQGRVANAAAIDSNGKLHSGTASLTRLWTDATQTMSLSATFTAAMQLQSLDTGAHARLASGTLQVSARHARWGAISGSATLGRGRDVLDHRLTQQVMQIQAERALTPAMVVKAYYLNSRNNVGITGLAYRDQVLGLQVRYSF